MNSPEKVFKSPLAMVVFPAPDKPKSQITGSLVIMKIVSHAKYI
jgi:hypothetical protein